MSCICKSPVRPDFKDSYNDLLDKPKINGVTLSGNLTPADLGIRAGAQFKVVQSLPTTNIDDATIYLVPVQVSQTDNIYQEWIYINNKWEKVGEPISLDVEKPTVFCKSINVQINPDDGYDFYALHTVDSFNAYASQPINKKSLYFSMKSDDGIDGIGISIFNDTSNDNILELSYINFNVGDSILGVPPGTFVVLNGELITTSYTILFSGEWTAPITI